MTRPKPKYVKQAMKNWCVPACLCSILESASDIFAQQKTQDILWSNPKRDREQTAINQTLFSDIYHFFGLYGIRSRLETKPPVDTIENGADSNKILILFHEQNYGHAVVYWKKDQEGVHYMDPQVLTETVTASIEDFKNKLEYAIFIPRWPSS